LEIKKEYNQSLEETYDDWKYRIILGKRDGKVDMSWDEIISMLGLTCSNDYLRKIAAGIEGYRNYLRNRNEETLENAPQSAIDAIDDKEFQLRRQKMRMQDQKRELNKKLREWARAEHIQEEFIKAVKDLPKLPEVNPINKINGDKEGILMLSDWHAGMVSDNACNIFNTRVLQERVQTLVDKTIEACVCHNIGKVHIFCLGDMVNGLIHVTTRINNEEDVVKQSMLVAELICKVINELLEVADVELYWSRGNHDRVVANKKESICTESFADMILWYIKARLENTDGLSFHENEVDDEIVVADVLGNTIFAAHGHKDKPTKAVENLSLLLKKFPDMVLLGHFHSAAEREVQGAEVIVNGSLCGTDAYAFSLRCTSHPVQKFLVMSEQGRECTYNIRLD